MFQYSMLLHTQAPTARADFLSHGYWLGSTGGQGRLILGVKEANLRPLELFLTYYSLFSLMAVYDPLSSILALTIIQANG
jgi:hypothetical protein